MSDDLRLNQLAREAQQSPSRSYQRRCRLNELCGLIFKSKKLYRPYRKTFPFAWSIYEDLYGEALNSTLLEICEKIERYDPKRDVMAWVNFLLEKRFADLFRQYTRRGITQVSRNNPTSSLSDLDRVPNLENLDRFLAPTPPLSEAKQLQELLEENPDCLFTKTYIGGNPKANFKFLAIARVWQDRTWKDISQELKISASHLCEFYNRQLLKFAPIFRKYLQD
ncbi:MAG: hypothetical protein J7641_09410 [Cyanobacteria bacterium SID2]|nr:hypothetical protein [Cyanobacteria bacterium SID2]MBP0005814.1 hypothetical protein [Cyanobacteria bacterium SBC]